MPSHRFPLRQVHGPTARAGSFFLGPALGSAGPSALCEMGSKPRVLVSGVALFVAAYVALRSRQQHHPELDVLVDLSSAAWDLFKPGGRLHPASFLEHQGHVLFEGALVIIIVYMFLQRSFKPRSKQNEPLTEKEIGELCEEWVPEPLAQPLPAGVTLIEPPVITSVCGTTVVANGKRVLNAATSNYLDMAGRQDILESTAGTVQKYGVGSCGPRGFYGTIDVHLALEKRIAAYLGTEGAIIYSYDLATLPSVIPAFANRNDLVVCDEGVNYAIQKGCNLSRAKVLYFKHNDMQDLERILAGVLHDDKTKNKAKPLNRRFLIVEGIYANYGDVCLLDQVYDLKEKYKFRLVVDESHSLGVMGPTGRGACEAFGLGPEQVEIISASLGNAIASVGGFCAGNHEIVEHQRLAGLGYCFSASLPPYLATAAIGALDTLDGHHGELLPTLARIAGTARALLSDVPGLKLVGGSSSSSPLIHLQLANPPNSLIEGDALMHQMAEDCLKKEGVLITAAKYSPLDLHRPPSSLKVCVSVAHTDKELQRIAAAVTASAKRVLRGKAAQAMASPKKA